MRSRRGCKQERSVRIELWGTVNNERSGRGGGSSRDLPKWLGKWSNQESLVFCGSQVKKVISRTSVHLCQRLQILVPVVWTLFLFISLNVAFLCSRNYVRNPLSVFLNCYLNVFLHVDFKLYLPGVFMSQLSYISACFSAWQGRGSW